MLARSDRQGHSSVEIARDSRDGSGCAGLSLQLRALRSRRARRWANGDALPSLLREAEDRGFAGLNITYPCKQAIIPLLHELSDEARVIGAVNTVRFGLDGASATTRTPGDSRKAFVAGYRARPSRRVVQVGAGGAGAATAHALLELGARKLSSWISTRGRAESLAAKARVPLSGTADRRAEDLATCGRQMRAAL